MAGSDNDDSQGAAPVGGSLHDVASLRDASSADVGRVLGLLAHDLRNPLAALASNVGFLQMVGKDLADEAREAVDDLVLSVEALGRIVDCLELVGHELGDRKPSSSSSLDVSSVIRAVRSHCERGAVSHGVTLTFKTEQADSLRIASVDHAFSMALGGLIHNALTVAPPRSEVVLEVVPEGDVVKFSVHDSGPPLPEEFQMRVFSAAAQAEIKNDRRARYSRGLGLYAVARACFYAGASLVPEEREGKSTISLIVPRATP